MVLKRLFIGDTGVIVQVFKETKLFKYVSQFYLEYCSEIIIHW